MTHFIEPSTEQIFSTSQTDSNIRMPSAEGKGGNEAWWLIGGVLIGTVIIIVINELVEK